MGVIDDANFFCEMISWILDNPRNKYKWSKVLHNQLNKVEINFPDKDKKLFYIALSKSNDVKTFIEKYK